MHETMVKLEKALFFTIPHTSLKKVVNCGL